MQSVLAPSLSTQEIANYFSQYRLPSVNMNSNNQFQIPGTERKVIIREIENTPGREAKLKVAYAQVKSEPGAFQENTAAHIASIKAAFERKCAMIQFPEMSLPHYCSLDLLLDRSYLKAQEKWLQEIVSFSKWKGRQITPATRITPLSAGFNRRIPINHQWRGQVPN